MSKVGNNLPIKPEPTGFAAKLKGAVSKIIHKSQPKKVWKAYNGKLPNGIGYSVFHTNPSSKFLIEVSNTRKNIDYYINKYKNEPNIAIFNGCQLEKYVNKKGEENYRPQSYLKDENGNKNSNYNIEVNNNRVAFGINNKGKAEIINENADINKLSGYKTFVGGLVPIDLTKDNNGYLKDLNDKGFNGFITSTTSNKTAVVVTKNNEMFFVHANSTNVIDLRDAIIKNLKGTDIIGAKAAAFDAGSATGVYMKQNGQKVFKTNRINLNVYPTESNNYLIIRP